MELIISIFTWILSFVFLPGSYHKYFYLDGWVRVLRPFNSISVISRRWKGEHERLCAMKHRLGSGRISPAAWFEPATLLPEVGSANRLATRMLLFFIWILSFVFYLDLIISVFTWILSLVIFTWIWSLVSLPGSYHLYFYLDLIISIFTWILSFVFLPGSYH